MRHAVLGAGGVGGLLSAALARSGVDVVVLIRPESLSSYPGRFMVDSQVLGDFEVDVPAVAGLDREVDVLWVTPKATQLRGRVEAGAAGAGGCRRGHPVAERRGSLGGSPKSV